MLSLAKQMGSLGAEIRTNPQAAAAYKAAEGRYRQISASLGGDDPGHVLSGAVNAKALHAPLKVRKVAPAAPAACGATTTNFTNSTPVAISATGTPVVTSTIVVSGVGPFLYDLDVTTFIQHTFSSDLDVTITSPAGTVVTLTTDNGSTFDDVFNGTVWDDNADPGTQVPYTANNNLVVEHTYANLTLASPLVPEEPLGAFIGENPNGTWTITISDDTNLDGGSLNSWSLGVTTLASAPTVTTLPTVTQSTPVAISATGTPVVTSTIVVAGAGRILDVNATTFIQHTFSSDLDVTLTSPAGTVVTLTTDNGSTFDDVFNGTVWDDDADPGTQVPYTADNNLVIEHTYSNLTLASPLVPEEPLAAFTGEDPNGTWTLTVSDDTNLDGGSINSWSLDIQTFTCGVALSADLSITKTDGVASATPGGTTTYTITAANAGPSAANPATVTDTLPAACTVSSSYTSTATGGATGNTASGMGNINDAALNLPAGSTVTYTVSCSIDHGATGSLTNTATISSAVVDPVPANNSATDTDTLVPVADLFFIKRLTTAGTIHVGDTVTFELGVTDFGPSDATGVTVTDTLPAGLTYVSNDCGATFASPTLTWNIGALAATTISAVCNITATVNQAGTIVNVATVTGNEPDPTPANNVATAAVTTSTSIAEVPTLDSLGLAALAILLAASAALALRRRRRAE
jgi:uncharacterized repeat protein (TIGR01451 family)